MVWSGRSIRPATIQAIPIDPTAITASATPDSTSMRCRLLSVISCCTCLNSTCTTACGEFGSFGLWLGTGRSRFGLIPSRCAISVRTWLGLLFRLLRTSR